MRQIRFRARSTESGEWLKGDLRHYEGDVYIFDQGGSKGELAESETVGQFTGLTDEFGHEVYEGDIVALDGSPGLGLRVVVFYEESFNIATRAEYDSLQQGAHPYLNDYAHMECLNSWSNTGLVRVVGNIHDNPEILAKADQQ